MSKFKVFISVANEEQLREFGEELGIVNDDHSFDEFLTFMKGLVKKYEKQVRN